MKKFITIEIKVPTEMNSKRAAQELSNAVYEVSVHFYESIGEYGKLTDNKRLYGNGHHMAQNIAQKAKELFNDRLEEKKPK